MFNPAILTGTGTGGTNSYSTIIIMVVMVGVFYFLMIRPESKKKKVVNEMRSNVSIGDEIVTIGGMIGVVCGVDGEKITYETGEDRVRIQIMKWGISSNVTAQKRAEAKKAASGVPDKKGLFGLGFGGKKKGEAKPTETTASVTEEVKKDDAPKA